jgi:hypothetical protein
MTDSRESYRGEVDKIEKKMVEALTDPHLLRNDPGVNTQKVDDESKGVKCEDDGHGRLLERRRR